MKIGIFTLPLYENYGGILQAYALKTYLEQQGHELWLIEHKPNHPLYIMPFIDLKRLFQRNVLKNKKIVPFSEKKRKITDIYVDKFKNDNFKNVTDNLDEVGFDSISKYNIDLVIVGSDQVWRKEYIKNSFSRYFLDFVSGKTLKMSYAASFGVSDWQFTEEETSKIKELLSHFMHISVREDSAVELLKMNTDLDSTHLVDPTMLLTPLDYNEIVNASESSQIKFEGDIFNYILDIDNDKKLMIDFVETSLNLKSFSVFNSKYVYPNDYTAKERIIEPLEKWLKGFKDAKFVVTDSFHGCVFSILYNKPFIVYANKKRGTARFDSVLRMFNLEDRLVYSKEEVTGTKLNSPINWERINNQLNREREKVQILFNQFD